MDKRDDKEKWVNDVLSSTEGMKKADSNPFLYEKIMYRMQDRNTAQDISASVLLPKWILGGVLILALNSVALVKEIHRDKFMTKANNTYAGMLSELGNQTTYNY
jgi:hypothetical protein